MDSSIIIEYQSLVELLIIIFILRFIYIYDVWKFCVECDGQIVDSSGIATNINATGAKL